MPRKQRIPLRSRSGRPEFDIDWEEVGFYLEAGASGSMIAESMGIDKTTLYKRCERDHGMNYSTYARLKKETGHKKILGKQYAKALQGDNTMLVWVGKQQLGQSENPRAEIEFNGKLAQFLDILKGKEVKKDDNTSDKHTEAEV